MAVKAANKATNKAVKAAVKAEKAKPKLEDFGIAIAPTFIGTEA
jgi:hypothetical protein